MTIINNAAEVQWQCQQLLNRVLILMDNADWTALVTCYTEDAELARPSAPNNPLIGRSNILESFKARPAKTTCHLLANSVFTVLDSDTVNATSRVLLMTGPALAVNEQFPLTADQGYWRAPLQIHWYGQIMNGRLKNDWVALNLNTPALEASRNPAQINVTS